MSSASSMRLFPMSTAQQATERLRFGFGKQLPLVLQDEEAEGGLACLAMVAGYHGYLTDMTSLRARFNVGAKGMLAKALLDTGAALNLTGQGKQVDLTKMYRLKTPCVLQWDQHRFVVLKQVVGKRGGIVIHDPAVGEVQLPMEEVAKRFTGVAIEFTRAAGFKAGEEKKSIPLNRMMGKVSGLRQWVVPVLLLAVAAEVFALLAPLLMQAAIDGGIVGGDRGLIGLLALGVGLLGAMYGAVGLARSWSVLYLTSHLNLQWASNVFTHLLRLPSGFFDKRKLGDVVARFQSIHAVQQTLSTSFIEAMIDGALSLVLLGVMLYYSVALSLVALAGVGLYAGLRRMFFAPLKAATEEHLVLAAREQALFTESVQSMQSIKLFNHEEERRDTWLNAMVDAMNRRLSAHKINIALRGAKLVILGAEAALVLWIAAGLVADNSFTLGMLVAFLAYKLAFSHRVCQLADRLVELQMLRLQGERLSDIVLAKPESSASDSLSRKKLSATDTSVELKDVWFRYSESEPWVLEGVSVKFRGGESAVLTGPSGAGKTTLIKLITGLLKPTKGEVLYGGVPIEKLGTRQYRRILGVVMQEDQLMSGTLAQNISFFDKRPNMERVTASATAAVLHDDIEKMEAGYQTLVGERGMALSSGQKQRLMLARALYKRPKLLLLDEAASHLDTAKERKVNATIQNLSMTRIVVSHRSDTARSVQRVVVLHKGKIAKDLRHIAASRSATATKASVRSVPVPPPILKSVKTGR